METQKDLDKIQEGMQMEAMEDMIDSWNQHWSDEQRAAFEKARSILCHNFHSVLVLSVRLSEDQDGLKISSTATQQGEQESLLDCLAGWLLEFKLDQRLVHKLIDLRMADELNNGANVIADELVRACRFEE